MMSVHIVRRGRVAAEEVLVDLLLAIGLSLSVGKLLEELFVRFGYPSVIGDLLAGFILGQSFLHIFPKGETIDVVAWFGVTLLLFYAGLDTRYGEFMRSLRRAFIVTLGEAISAFMYGVIVGLALGYPLTTSIFLGAILEATSVSVSVRTLMDIGKLNTREGMTILGVAVLDDVTSLLTIVAATSIVVLHRLDITQITQIVAMAAIFWLGVVLIVHKVNTPIVRYLRKMKAPEPVISGILATFALLGVVAKDLKISPLVAAYAAGLAFSDARGIQKTKESIRSLAIVMSTLFFVNTVASRNLVAAIRPEYTLFYVLMIAAAFAGKLTGAGLVTYLMGYGGVGALRVAVGLFPRAEFCIIAASMGMAVGAIGEEAYLAAVLITAITNFATPPLLKIAFTKFRSRFDTDYRYKGRQARP